MSSSKTCTKIFSGSSKILILDLIKLKYNVATPPLLLIAIFTRHFYIGLYKPEYQ